MSDTVPMLPRWEVYHVGFVGSFRVGPTRQHDSMPGASDQHQLLWFLSGPREGTLAVNGIETRWSPGDLLLVRPLEKLSLFNSSPQDITALMVGFSVHIPPPPEEAARWPRLRSDLRSLSAIPTLLRFCAQADKSPEPQRTTLLSGAISLILHMFISGVHQLEAPTPNTRELPKPLTLALAALLGPEANVRRLTPRWLALQAGVTSDHLTDLARQHLGTSLQRLIQLQRLKLACDLLTETAMAVKEVAHSCGFAYPHYFARQFAKELACTPSEYRLLSPSRRPAISLPAAAALLRQEARTYGSASLYSRYSKHVSPKDLQHALQTDLKQEQRAYRGLSGSSTAWQTISLTRVTNRSRRTGPDSWIGQGYHLTQLTPGKHQIHGITFGILDEGTARNRSVLILRSARLRANIFPHHAAIKIDQAVQAVAVLHACGWANAQRQLAGTYEMEFADGQITAIPLWTAGEPPDLRQQPLPLLQDWWPTYHQFDHANARKVTLCDAANPLSSIRYLYTYVWRNPRPEVPVKAWHIRTTGQQQATLAVLALSVLPAAPQT